MTLITAGLSTSLDGFIAGADDSPTQPLGLGGERLFRWFVDGDTPSRFYPSSVDANHRRCWRRNAGRSWDPLSEQAGGPLLIPAERSPLAAISTNPATAPRCGASDLLLSSATAASGSTASRARARRAHPCLARRVGAHRRVAP
jgi:hypothetical protein